MTSIILGSGGTAGATIGGDLGGTPATPQVIGSHFGGVPGNFWVNRAGLWVPDTIQASDLPPINHLTNGTNTFTLGTDGVLATVGPNATLGALQTNVASQYVNGSTAGGFCRVTVSATAVAANANIIIINFPGALNTQAGVFISPIGTANAQFGSGFAVTTPVNGIPYAVLTQATNTPLSSFIIRCTAALTASLVFGFVYQVRQ